MGGVGSGTWYRWDRREHLDDHINIDVQRWKRDGFLHPGNRFDWQWTVNDEVSDSIRIRVEQDRVVLVYRQRAYGGDWQDFEEPVYLVHTDCNFGGQRVWFQCPSCGRRAAKLYSQVPYFVCRRCCRLPYQCQGESLSDRAMRKARRIRRKLNASMRLIEPIWSKPKGMHWKTFNRLKQQAEIAERVSWCEAAKHLPGLREHIRNLY